MADDTPRADGPYPPRYEPAAPSIPAFDPQKRMPNDYPAPGYTPPPPPAPVFPPAPGYPGMPGYATGAPEPRRPVPGYVKLLGGCLGVCVVLFALLVALAAIASFTSASASGTSSRSFAVSGTPTIRVHSAAANIHVTTGASSSVSYTLKTTVRALTAQMAQDDINATTVTANQSGDVVDLTLNDPDTRSGFFGFHLQYKRTVDLDLTVPAASNIEVTQQAGNITLVDTTGSLTVTTSAGNVELDDVTLTGASALKGNAGNFRLRDTTVTTGLTLRSDAGNIDFDGTLARGASLDVRVNAGNITLALPVATDAHLTASTQVGNVSIDSAWNIPVTRDVTHATASGDMSAHPSGTVAASADIGNVTITTR